ncbi:alpha/beta hydrolase [Hymenobacter cavernae]|uniref:Esterase n=1 Tax=Hymenobacter cavernae TaxID=2044852 RepID=A0ABQ1U518_9BACT|nr:alpha/beta hydrolase-fold protein [Hymenobacter cavernae]GGF09707.1 esterase [Hymenobacter cavernae]
MRIPSVAKLLNLGLLWLLAGTAYAQQSSLVTVPNSEHQVIQSKVAGHPYDVYVHFPAGYATSGKKYPVLYVVDGDNDFSPTLEYLGLLMAEYHIPEPLVVAIGDGGLIGTPGNQRNRDFTPTAMADRPGSGGAPAFLGFIEQELMPFVEKKYKADPAQRTLYGYSMGGLFGTYVLFQKPTLFQNILIGSPALGYDNGKIFDIENAYHAKHTDLPVHVFVEVGELETPGQKDPYQKLVQLLQARHYQNLDLHTVVIEKVTHMTGKPVTMLKALGWAYTSPHVVF